MAEITINGVTLRFNESAFTAAQWEQVASWVLNGGGESAAINAQIATEKASEAVKSAASADEDANSAKSYAVGGTGTRDGENTDNAKFYCEQAHAIAGEGTVFSVNGQQADEVGNVNVTKDNIGLDKVNNTADTEKPVSRPQQQALDQKAAQLHAAQHKKGGIDALAAADIDAAPAGYGYGGTVIDLGLVNEAELETKLTELLGTMQPLEAKQFCANGFVYSDWRFFGTLYKSSANYASCLMQSPYAYGSIVQKVYYAGDGWMPYEWVNPRMELDGEYRTAERYNAKPVYATWVNFGALADSAEKGIDVAKLANTTVISIHGYAHGNDGTYYMALPGYKGIASMGVTRWTGRLWITTNMDMSAYKAYVCVKYVKD